MGKFKSLADYSAAGYNIHSGENQRILSDLVSNNIICCVSYLISDLYKLISNADASVLRDVSFSEDDLHELMYARASDETAVEEAGYAIVEFDHEWYWYNTSDPVPFGNVLPDKYFVSSKLDENGTLIWCYYYSSLDDADWEENGMFSESDARQAAWAAYCSENNQGPYYDEDEAYEGCIDENLIDKSDYDSEIYEHWAVSSFFERKLTQFGETVRDVGNLSVWGRGCTGQSIALDYVIAKIAFEMEILDGQENSWAKKEPNEDSNSK